MDREGATYFEMAAQIGKRHGRPTQQASGAEFPFAAANVPAAHALARPFWQ